jgi:hypothetical protein
MPDRNWYTTCTTCLVVWQELRSWYIVSTVCLTVRCTPHTSFLVVWLELIHNSHCIVMVWKGLKYLTTSYTDCLVVRGDLRPLYTGPTIYLFVWQELVYNSQFLSDCLTGTGTHPTLVSYLIGTGTQLTLFSDGLKENEILINKLHQLSGGLTVADRQINISSEELRLSDVTCCTSKQTPWKSAKLC